MSSILERHKLTIENFEDAIAVGMSAQQVRTMFNVTNGELDAWCMENYKHNFSTTWEIIRQATYQEFLGIVRELGYRGNPSALNILNSNISSHAADNIVKIVFDNNMKKEDEKDKEDD